MGYNVFMQTITVRIIEDSVTAIADAINAMIGNIVAEGYIAEYVVAHSLIEMRTGYAAIVTFAVKKTKCKQ